MTIYNAELIESVQAFDKSKDNYYHWNGGLKFLGIEWITAGWRGWGGDIVSEEKLLVNHLIENGVVYNKPYMLMRCASGQTKVTKFDTFKDAQIAAIQIATKFNIKITL